MEQWKEMGEYPNYQISNYGRVKLFNAILAIPDKYLNFKDSNNRYHWKTIPVLVYKYFVSSNPIHRVYYKDGNEQNHRWDNLWSSKDRNNAILEDFNSGMSLDDIRQKYKIQNPHSLKLGLIRKNEKKIKKELIKEPEILDPTIEKLRERYRAFDLAAEIGKGMSLNWWDLDLTVQPRNRY